MASSGVAWHFCRCLAGGTKPSSNPRVMKSQGSSGMHRLGQVADRHWPQLIGSIMRRAERRAPSMKDTMFEGFWGHTANNFEAFKMNLESVPNLEYQSLGVRCVLHLKTSRRNGTEMQTLTKPLQFTKSHSTVLNKALHRGKRRKLCLAKQIGLLQTQRLEIRIVSQNQYLIGNHIAKKNNQRVFEIGSSQPPGYYPMHSGWGWESDAAPLRLPTTFQMIGNKC